MEKIPPIGEKKTLQMRESEMQGKLRGKNDWYTFLSQHL